ncbi:MAG: SpoIIE family protein phosphatase [Bacteroidetes bacterium]|nr:SpoIIE family protein phosphatase [Bacteroidota bacterium]
MGIINLESGEINYCNAGHNYPYIIRPGDKLVCLDQTHETPLGFFENTNYKSTVVNLKEGERNKINNNIDELPKLNAFIQNIATTGKFSKELLFDLQVVLEELTVTIKDDSKEFNILKIPPFENLNNTLKYRIEGGLGINLVKALVDNIKYGKKTIKTS